MWIFRYNDMCLPKQELNQCVQRHQTVPGLHSRRKNFLKSALCGPDLFKFFLTWKELIKIKADKINIPFKHATVVHFFRC